MNTIADFQVSSKLWAHYLCCFCCYCNVSTYPFSSLLQVHHIKEERNHLSTETVGKKTLFMCNIYFLAKYTTQVQKRNKSVECLQKGYIWFDGSKFFFLPVFAPAWPKWSILSSWWTDWLWKPKLISTGDTAVAFE